MLCKIIPPRKHRALDIILAVGFTFQIFKTLPWHFCLSEIWRCHRLLDNEAGLHPGRSHCLQVKLLIWYLWTKLRLRNMRRLLFRERLNDFLHHDSQIIKQCYCNIKNLNPDPDMVQYFMDISSSGNQPLCYQGNNGMLASSSKKSQHIQEYSSKFESLWSLRWLILHTLDMTIPDEVSPSKGTLELGWGVKQVRICLFHSGQWDSVLQNNLFHGQYHHYIMLYFSQQWWLSPL